MNNKTLKDKLLTIVEYSPLEASSVEAYYSAKAQELITPLDVTYLMRYCPYKSVRDKISQEYNK